MKIITYIKASFCKIYMIRISSVNKNLKDKSL